MSFKGRNLGFYYQEPNWLFRNIDIEIQAGELVGLHGRSGIGKSTLARILAGYEKPIEGEILIENQKIRNQGYSPVQLIHQHPEKTFNPLWKIGNSLNEAKVTSTALKTALKIDESWLQKYPNEISGGQQQRIAIARAISVQPRYLLADEITSMMDSLSQAEIWHFLLNLAKEQGIGMLIISHDLKLLAKISDRLIEGL